MCDKLINMQTMNSNELSKLSPKLLKEYINAYNLPFKTAIEKSDLVRIIFNTRPISNESEYYYRRHKSKFSISASNSNEDSNNTFSFTNMVQDFFTAPSISVHELMREDQLRRQQHEQRQSTRPSRCEPIPPTNNSRLPQRGPNPPQSPPIPPTNNNRTPQRASIPPTNNNRAPQREPIPPTNNSRPPPPPSSSPLLSNKKLLSLHDLIETESDPSSLSVRTLKSILKENYVEHSHAIEKSELVKLVARLVDQRKANNKKNDGNEDSLCRICFDNQQNCVFLNCGHMVACMECAKKLIETKNECPICRATILKLVHVFRS